MPRCPGRPARLVLIGSCLCCLLMARCSGGNGVVGQIRAESVGAERVVLDSEFITAYYLHDAASRTAVFLSDVPLEDLLDGRIDTGQVIHIEVLWVPKAGKTPLDGTATNVSIRHIVFSNGELGVYEGGGFAMPSGKFGAKEVSLELRSSTMTLGSRTAGFVDQLSPAQVTGKLTARRDDKITRQIQFAISQIVTDAMGESQTVQKKAQRHEGA